eukprot:CAMPEP_0175046970 /NCGR_PEP_ID=MMETSP0052_2-20121109/5332_1 /TAXON_ID=51329 ORGANISM="Polytomella parva, Strain SAG 63-3" /NCGR_SAMPLE_ID=MMETSP0052_2 /ASSEMBLY_ACC=CAM_ASM_000194 /LENGTH=332 /DNA_ID=CAMNT_0016310787 /DNA_START=69 /DNA_END=1064 /DNA_ORIENTATION=+
MKEAKETKIKEKTEVSSKEKSMLLDEFPGNSSSFSSNPFTHLPMKIGSQPSSPSPTRSLSQSHIHRPPPPPPPAIQNPVYVNDPPSSKAGAYHLSLHEGGSATSTAIAEEGEEEKEERGKQLAEEEEAKKGGKEKEEEECEKMENTLLNILSKRESHSAPLSPLKKETGPFAMKKGPSAFTTFFTNPLSNASLTQFQRFFGSNQPLHAADQEDGLGEAAAAAADLDFAGEKTEGTGKDSVACPAERVSKPLSPKESLSNTLLAHSLPLPSSSPPSSSSAPASPPLIPPPTLSLVSSTSPPNTSSALSPPQASSGESGFEKRGSLDLKRVFSL